MSVYKAIILASGRGERCAPLTDDKNKVLLEIKGKSILEWTLDSLSKIDEIKEIFIGVDWKKEDIIKKIGKRYKGKPIKYVDTPHLPKGQIDEDYATDDAGMDLKSYRNLRNQIEYPKAIFSTAINDADFKKTDYYLRFNGDVLFDKKSLNTFLSKVRKEYDIIEGLLFSAYKPKAIELLYKLLKTNKWKFAELNNEYLTNAFYRKDVNHEMSLKEFYDKIINLIAVENLPRLPDAGHAKSSLHKSARFLKDLQDSNLNRKAFLNKEDFEELYELFSYLHKHQHVDTKEHYNALKKHVFLSK